MWYFSVSSPCWTIANLETCSFIRFNNAFRKTLLRAAKRKTRKLTDYRKQLLSRALISSRIVLSHENENCGKWSQVMVFVVAPREEDEERCRQHYKHMILGFISVWKPVKFFFGSLYSLFYVTREFQRFLHRGWTWFNAYCSLLDDLCTQNVITKKKSKVNEPEMRMSGKNSWRSL